MPARTPTGATCVIHLEATFIYVENMISSPAGGRPPVGVLSWAGIAKMECPPELKPRGDKHLWGDHSVMIFESPWH